MTKKYSILLAKKTNSSIYCSYHKEHRMLQFNPTGFKKNLQWSEIRFIFFTKFLFFAYCWINCPKILKIARTFCLLFVSSDIFNDIQDRERSNYPSLPKHQRQVWLIYSYFSTFTLLGSRFMKIFIWMPVL